VASVYIFMEAGIGLGALASGFIYANDSSRFGLSFSICSALAVIAFLYLLLNRSATKFVE
jgi:hypothetical protein